MNRFHACERCTQPYRCKICSDYLTAEFDAAQQFHDNNIPLYHPDHAVKGNGARHVLSAPKKPWICELCAAAV